MPPSLPALGLLGLIQVYKWTLSPLIGRGCRYLPTCSTYAADCVRMHGAWAGSWMAGARLCRCAPWGGHGWDPAPDTVRKNSWWRPWRYGDWIHREPSPLVGEGREGGAGGSSSGENTAVTPTPNPAPKERILGGGESRTQVEKKKS